MNKNTNKRMMKKVLFLLVNLIVLTMLLLAALPITISVWWLDNLVNLQMQWAALAIIMLVMNITYIKKSTKVYGTLYTLLIINNFMPLYLSPLVNASSGMPISKDLQRVTIAQLNLNYNNPNLESLLSTLADERFDLLIIQEASDKEHRSIKKLNKYYPYSFGLSETEATPSGMAIFSRLPITEKKIHDLNFKSGQLLEIIVQVPNSVTPIQVWALHPSSPRNKALWQLRNKTLSALTDKIITSAFTHKVVVGDFNSSPWSTPFKHLQKQGQLKNSADSFGYFPSWSYSDAPIFSTLSSAYIDHCLISTAFNVLNKQSQSISGSDHQLVITDLAISFSRLAEQ